MKRIFVIGEQVKAINNAPLPGNKIAPPLKEGETYSVNGIILDTAGNQHLDVGLKSEYEYVTSFETKEQLKDGHKIHWCHPSRFE